MFFGSALDRALLLHDVLGKDGRRDEVVGPHLPLGGEGRSAGELETRVGVVAQGIPLAPRPDVTEKSEMILIQHMKTMMQTVQQTRNVEKNVIKNTKKYKFKTATTIRQHSSTDDTTDYIVPIYA